MPASLITITSDFGPGPFVGVMKGVILAIAPQARLIDLSHAVPPQDVAAGALLLEDVMRDFPAGTVHLAVVDPQVGTSRRGVCLKARDQIWVGPDNGLFSAVLSSDAKSQIFELTNQEFFRSPVSPTFHGRDIFAPVSAHLALGIPLEKMGPRLDDPVLLEWPRPERQGEILQGQVLGWDSFGNLYTNIKRAEVHGFLDGAPGRIWAGDAFFGPLRSTYDQAAPGEPLALINSSGRLELAINRGDARVFMGLERDGEAGLLVRLRKD